LLLALAAGGAVFADVRVGDVREAQVKSGVPVREAPKALAKVTGTLAYRTRVRVEEVSGSYARVSTDAGLAGWVKTGDLVMPGTLTGGGTAAAGGAASSSDVSAAGRQFDQSIEGEYRASRAELAAAYAAVDALEAKSFRPGAPEVHAFVVDGRLGR
jgi:hypothetical protein